MGFTLKHQKLLSLPVQIIEMSNGVTLKRGCTEVRITGPDAGQAVKMILDAARTGSASLADIRKLFAPSSGRRVEQLMRKLLKRRLLVPSSSHGTSINGQESHTDIFFWHFGETADRIIKELNKVHLVIIGVNSVSRQLAVGLNGCGYNNFEIFDHPQHRNVRFFDKTGSLKNEQWPVSLSRPQDWDDSQEWKAADCLVATSDFGGQDAMCQWNKLCKDHSVHFMPVMLKNMVGYVGPLIIPGETACYECFLFRQRSHALEPDAEQFADKAAFQGQGIIGFHPSMATILGDIAAFELTRFYADVLPVRSVGTLLEVNLLAASITERKVLRVPRCPTCSALMKKSRPNITKAFFNDRTHPR
jgi:bacteriocin biosynthesis cyclodehydratase domain-containing protein